MLDGSRAGGSLPSPPWSTDSAPARKLWLDGLLYQVLVETLTLRFRAYLEHF